MGVYKKQEKKVITFEQIVVGAILKFGIVDSLDLRLLIEDLKNKGLAIEPRFGAPNLGKYIMYFDNNKYCINSEIPLDSIIPDENCTVYEKIIQIVGREVLAYYDSLDVEEFRQSKETFLATKGIDLLEKGNVLLISDDEKDYNALINYGFKNVNYFKSIIRADRHFQKHPDEINEYHIIITGSNKVKEDLLQELDIEKKIKDITRKNNILVVPIRKFTFSHQLDASGQTEYSSFLHDKDTNRSYHTFSNSYAKMFDQIFTCALINNVIDNKTVLTKFKPIADRAINNIELPSKKSDVKILYLDAALSDKFTSIIANKLGLNINYEYDASYGINGYAQNHLGDYDIIIASSLHASNLLHLNEESTEQCKDTGRKLTLLVTYEANQIANSDEKGVYDALGYGDSIRLNYAFGGIYAPDNEKHAEIFRVISPLNKGTVSQRFFASRNSIMEAIVKESVNIYNRALVYNQEKPISDLDFKTADEYDKEYTKLTSKDQKQFANSLEAIKAFDKLYISIVTYLKYQKAGLITQAPNGINIIDNNDNFKIENAYESVLYGILIIPKIQCPGNIRIFEIQTSNSKGTLDIPRIVGIYPEKYQNSPYVPSLANNNDLKAIMALTEKIDSLVARNEEVYYSSTLKGKTRKRNRKK